MRSRSTFYRWKMVSKHINSIDLQDIERVRKENVSLREDLGNLRDEIAGERKTHAQLLESFQVCHNEDARRLREEKKLTDTLAEESSQLRTEIKSIRQRNKSSPNSHEMEGNVAAQLLKELSALDKRLGLLHGDLMKSLFMKNVQGKEGTKAGEALALKEDFKRLMSELANLRSLLTNGLNTVGPNGILLPALREGSRTEGLASNSVVSNTTNSPEDLVHLTGPITEDSIVQVLHHRSAAGQNYTNIGPMLIMLNSFDVRPVGTDQLQRLTDPHHLSSVIQEVMQRLAVSSTPQVIVLSGCSGSGKTFTSQMLSQHLLHLAGGGVDSDISKHLLASLTAIHSLGNAKTSTNSNSSRMGKFLEFHLTDGIISRTKVNCYLLDCSRVVEQLPGERNFNIFYELLAGITQEERAKVHLLGYSAHSLNYLGNSAVANDKEEEQLKVMFDRWRTALVTLGIPFTDVLRILVAILLLGNIKFVAGEAVELDVKGNNEIKAVAALLGVSGVSLYRGLTTKTKNLRGQLFRSLCDSSTANNTRDCLAKALYSRFVSAIGRRVNSYKRPNSTMSLSPQGSVESVMTPPGSPSPFNLLRKSQLSSSGLLVTHTPGTPPLSPDGSFSQGHRGLNGMIDIVDMFGFENAQVNRLEQICINLCSETIQHYYNTHIFKTSEQYCREESLLSNFVLDYRDNAPCIELLTCQRVGVLTILDKESLFPRGTYQNFLQKIKVQHKDSECFFDPNLNNSCFGITHYGGEVVYDANSLLNINRDTISDDIICVFSRQNCNFGFATHLFANDLRTQQGQAAAPKGALHRIASTNHESHSPGPVDIPQHTFSLDFQERIDSLLKILVQAQPLFVRCIKANTREEPHSFDRGVVSQQVRVLQLFETVQLLQSGFAYHARFSKFVSKFSFLARRRVRGREETGHEDCKVILETLLRKANRDKAKLIVGAWALGKRYVFYSEVIKQELERLRDNERISAIVTVQAWVRGWICRKRWPNQSRSLELQHKGRHPPKDSQSGGGRTSVSPTEELSVDTKSTEQSCCLYGLDMETPPPVPKRRPYTVMGNMKMGFPQMRVMKYDFPDDEVIFKKGEAVKVVSSSDKRGYLVVEHRNGTCHVPFQCMELKASPHPSPR